MINKNYYEEALSNVNELKNAPQNNFCKPSFIILYVEYLKRGIFWNNVIKNLVWAHDFFLTDFNPCWDDLEIQRLDSETLNNVCKKNYSKSVLKDYLHWSLHNKEIVEEFGRDLNRFEPMFWYQKRSGWGEPRPHMGQVDFYLEDCCITLLVRRLYQNLDEIAYMTEFSDEILDEIDREFDKDPMAFKEKYLPFCSMYKL